MADEKVERFSPSALIPVKGTNFFNMHSVEELNASISSAPPFHQAVTRALVAAGKVREEVITPEQLTLSREQRVERHTVKMDFGRGANVLIGATGKKPGRKVVIIQANAGVTKKTHTPVHKVANSKGESWLEKQSDLSLLL